MLLEQPCLNEPIPFCVVFLYHFLPTLAEQEAIAEALSDADALIEALETLIAKKRQVKQGAMQELLTGIRRLPGFSGDWEFRTLVEFVKSEKFAIVDGPFGTQMKVHEFVSEGIPVIEMEHLGDAVISQRLERHITPEKFEQIKRSAVYRGDIVISKTGSLGHLVSFLIISRRVSLQVAWLKLPWILLAQIALLFFSIF